MRLLSPEDPPRLDQGFPASREQRTWRRIGKSMRYRAWLWCRWPYGAACLLYTSGIALINNDGPMKLHRDQARELEERRARLYYFPATKLSLEVAGMDLCTNMALMGLSLIHI